MIAKGVVVVVVDSYNFVVVVGGNCCRRVVVRCTPEGQQVEKVGNSERMKTCDREAAQQKVQRG